MKFNKNIFKVLAGVMAVVLTVAGVTSFSPSDGFIRDRVVQIISSKGSCSGEQIEAPSGESYILTAGHCKPSDSDSVKVVLEDGRSLKRRVIAEDEASDLLLVEGVPNLTGLSIAEDSHRFQHVRTFTHGNRFQTYKTEGELIDNTGILIPIYMLETLADVAKCEAMPKNRAVMAFFGPVCALSVVETASTAMIVPGSSGGAVIDDNGDIVGVASASGGGFSYFVRLGDIQKFLYGY